MPGKTLSDFDPLVILADCERIDFDTMDYSPEWAKKSEETARKWPWFRGIVRHKAYRHVARVLAERVKELESVVAVLEQVKLLF